MRYKIKLEKSKLIRLQNYINSNYYNQNDLDLTTHWDKRLKDYKDQIFFKDDCILINDFNNGFDENFKSNFVNIPSKKISFKNIFAHGLSQFIKKNQPLERLKSHLVREKYNKIILPHKKLYRQKALAYLFLNDIFNLKKLNDLNKINFLEIGSGSGLFASLVLEYLDAQKIDLIDLPQVIPYAFIYLSHKHPNINISLPNELDLRNSSLISFSIPGDLKDISSFNLMINTLSFGEMKMSAINSYMEFLRNKCESENIFYCYNRVEKYIRNAKDIDKKLHPIRFTEYPWSKNDEVLLYKLDDFNHIFTSQPMFKKAVKLSKNK